MLSLNDSFEKLSIFSISYAHLFIFVCFHEQLIGEINLRSDPFDEDIVQASKSSSTRLVRYLDHPTKKYN